MKVLVSDNLGDVGIQMFKEAPGIEVDVKTGLSTRRNSRPSSAITMRWRFAAPPR
jgi:hypothetical protein